MIIPVNYCIINIKKKLLSKRKILILKYFPKFLNILKIFHTQYYNSLNV